MKVPGVGEELSLSPGKAETAAQQLVLYHSGLFRIVTESRYHQNEDSGR